MGGTTPVGSSWVRTRRGIDHMQLIGREVARPNESRLSHRISGHSGARRARPYRGGGQATDKRQDGTLIILGMLCDRLIMLCVNLITQRPARVSGPPSVCASTGAHHRGNAHGNPPRSNPGSTPRSAPNDSGVCWDY